MSKLKEYNEINTEVEIYDPDADTRFHKNKKYNIFINTELKFKKHRKIDIDRLKKYNPHIKELHMKDQDTIEYRIDNCIENGGLSLDLSHLNLENLPKNIPSTVKYLFCSNNNLFNIKDISYLKNLKVFDCSCNQLINLPILPENLIELSCRNNYLKDINSVTKCKKIKRIDISYNKINRIPNFENLEILACDNNNIYEIYSMNNLIKLYCKNNRISKLNKFNKLELLDCRENQITIIKDYSKLLYLYCNNNKINYIDNLENIKSIECLDNNIKKIKYFENLEELVCDYDKTFHLHKKYKEKIDSINIYKKRIMHILFI